MGNVAIVIAHNEEVTISNVISGLINAKQKGIISTIVVVNDGSTDKTSELSKAFGIEVLNLSHNVGKGQAFIHGVEYCAKFNPKNILTFDGDLLEVTLSQVKKLLNPLKNPKTNMVVGSIKGDGSAMSGERAIRFSALAPLVKAKNKNWIKHMQQFGLESALNHYLGLKSVFLPKIFDLFGGRIYNGFHPFNKKVVVVRTRFRALPFNRRGSHVTENAVKKRFELISREDKARILIHIRKMRDLGKTKSQIKKKLKKF
jgi:polyisoprenyl-phosphate glycosyltransferase